METSKYLLVTVAIAVIMMASPVTARERSALRSAGDDANSLWDHNGSTVYLVADGNLREFYYNQPRPGMLQAGARPGSLLFSGRSVNGRYVGTAYIFNRQCGQMSYRVSGPILDNDERVVLKGQASRFDSDCNILDSYTDTLEFSLLQSGKRAANVLDSYAYAPPPSTNAGQLSSGTELRVVNVRANDVLKMREDATEESRVIDTIPPNVEGAVYLGETQGQWIFVQYDRSKGWVNRRFVMPLASRGGRIQ
jgi:hypothetical protein